MVAAKILWMKPENGGKAYLPPLGEPFYPMIKLESDKDLINWSFCLINKAFTAEYETLSSVGFLMETAPLHLLQKGVRFTLFEGTKKIACGEII